MNSPEHICFLNGESSDSVSVRDRGFCYGHGLFETIRLTNGEAPLWRYHLMRLKHGAEELGIKLNENRLLSFYRQLLSVCPSDGVVKLLVTAGSGGRGYQSRQNSEPNYLLQWFPLPSHSKDWGKLGVSLKNCEHRLPHAPRLAGIKHLNRLDQVLARAEWNDEYPEGLMSDTQGNVIEGVSSNLFYRCGQQWMTPMLDQCGVAGVMRKYLMEVMLPDLSVQLQESQTSMAELIEADEVFVCNSVNGIWPVVSLEQLACWPIGEWTRQLQQQLRQNFPCYA